MDSEKNRTFRKLHRKEGPFFGVVVHEKGEILSLRSKPVLSKQKMSISAKVSVLQRPEILDSLNEGILSLDAHGCITQFNAVTPQVLGCPAEVLLGSRLFTGLWAPKPDGSQQHSEKHRPDLMALKTKETQKNILLQFQNPDGRKPWLQTSVIPIFEPRSNQVLRLVVTLTEVTPLKESQENKQKEADYKSWLLDSAGYAMFATDESGQIKLFNKAAQDLLGYIADEVVGKLSVVVLHDFFEIVQKTEQINTDFGLQLSPGFETLKKNVEIHRRSEGEWTLIRKDGLRVPVFISMTKMATSTGELAGYLTIARDITEELRLREDITKKNAALIQASKMVSLANLAGGVAHEINNPLAVMYGKIARVQRLIQSPDYNLDDVLSDLSKMRVTAERIAEIVRGLQSFSRSSSEPSVFQTLSVDEVFRMSLSLCSQLFENHGVQLHVKSTEDLVSVKPQQMAQVILALLSNALDAVRNQPVRWVRLEAMVNGGKVQISITDSGTGIDDKLIDKLMEPFFTTKDIGKGTGLGLSMAKGVVEDHGGVLELDRSSPNTRFTFTVSLVTAAQKSA